MSFRLSWYKSIRGQFNLALATLTFLIFCSGFIGTYTLKEIVGTSNQLGEERLTRLEEAQNLVQTALLIEHESQLMLAADSLDGMRESYSRILNYLDTLDRLVSELGQAGTSVSILKFQRAAQLFRGTVHVLAKLHDQVLKLHVNRMQDSQELKSLHSFNRNLVQQGAELLVASQALSSDFSISYRQSVQQLTEQSEQRHFLVVIVLGVSLVLAWLVSSLFLGRMVITPLQQVSHFLRSAGQDNFRISKIPVSGDDEVGQMARAVEQYMLERQQLAKIQQEAMQTARFVAVGQLASGLAHEINTPSQYITMNLQFLRDVVLELNQNPACAQWKEDLEEAASAAVESIQGIQKISNIVQSMKEFSRPGVSSRCAADINQALENSLTVTKNHWEGIAQIERHFDPELPLPVCDISKINQVFLNLIVNAIEAIESSGNLPGTISITTARQGAWIEIRISDSGTGIPEEIRDRIFDPFFTTKPVGSGTGQGLTICHDIIVQKHGGSIDLSTDPPAGMGAEFVIRLPFDSDNGAVLP